MSDILTITLNPAIDLAASVPRVIAGPKLYTSQPRVDPGGGGVNVARAIGKLGGNARALVTVGGAMGDRLLALMAAEGVETVAVPVRGETRQSFAVTDEGTGEQFRFSVPGEILHQADADRLLAAIADAAPQGGYVVLSGGVAPGLGDDFPQRIQAAIAPKTDRLIVDTSKAPLSLMIAQPTSPVFMLRVDQNEAMLAAGHPIDRVEDSVAFAADLVVRGVARNVVTGRGAAGSVLVTQTARYMCHAVSVPVRSKIGAGDAFVGAMTLALARGDAPDQALRWGVATACATVGTEGTELCDPDMARSLFDRCEVEQL